MNPMGKRVAILGLGKSGYESALFLKDKGFCLWVTDQTDSAAIHERASDLQNRGIDVEVGRHSKEQILSCDWVLISPGISPNTSIYQAVKPQNLPIPPNSWKARLTVNSSMSKCWATSRMTVLFGFAVSSSRCLLTLS